MVHCHNIYHGEDPCPHAHLSLRSVGETRDLSAEDLREPVAVLAVSVLHAISDADDPPALSRGSETRSAAVRARGWRLDPARRGPRSTEPSVTTCGPILLNRNADRMNRHAATRRLHRLGRHEALHYLANVSHPEWPT
jgi:hypothetical protein